jgi:hypothetical protein
MTQDLDLYYKAPSDKIFNEIKKEAIKIWESYDDTYGYATEKINKVKDIKNIRDSVMFIFGMFDVHNQRKLMEALSDASRIALRLRLPVEYNLMYLSSLKRK